MDIGKAFSYVFEDEGWISKVLIGGLLIWIPIVAPEQECVICLGLLRNSRNAVQIHDFDDISEDLVTN